MYIKIVQIKILYDNDCKSNKHEIPTYIPKMYKTVQNLYKVPTKSNLKLDMYVFCTYKQCKKYAKPVQLAN